MDVLVPIAIAAAVLGAACLFTSTSVPRWAFGWGLPLASISSHLIRSAVDDTTLALLVVTIASLIAQGVLAGGYANWLGRSRWFGLWAIIPFAWLFMLGFKRRDAVPATLLNDGQAPVTA